MNHRGLTGPRRDMAGHDFPFRLARRRGGPWTWGLGLTLGFMLACLRPLVAAELRDLSFHVTASATDLVFTFDSAVRPEAVEEGLDVVLRLPADVDLHRLTGPVSVHSSQVRRVWAAPERREIRIERSQVLPYEVRPQAEGFVVRVYSVGPTAPTDGTVPGKVASVTAREVTIVQLADTAVAVKLTMDGPSSATRWKSLRLSNPARWVFDIEPLRFWPLAWKRSPQHAWLKQLRVAQFQTDPTPVTRVVMEVMADDVQPDVQVEADGLRITLVRPTQVPTEAQGTSAGADTGGPGTSADSPTPLGEAPPASSTEVPTPSPTAPEPSSTPLPPVPTVKVASDSQSASVPGPQSDWDPRFFDTRDIVFYQAQTEQEAQEAAKKAQELAIFKEKAIAGPKKYEGEPISLEFTDVHVKDLMGIFSDISGLNILLDPKVEGEQYRIPLLRLKFVPWDQALDLVLRMLGLGYVLEGNVLRVAPIEDLRKEAEELQKLQENIGTLQTVIKPLSYADATQVSQLASRLLTPRGEIFVDTRTNTLIIKETDVNMPNILNLISTLDTPIPQVNIEVRIVETRRTFTQQLGIQWGFRGLMSPALGNSTSLVFPNSITIGGNVIQATTGITGNPLGGYAVNLPSLQAPTGAMLLSFGSVMDTFRLDLALMALESAGLARVISSPRISTQNNQKADIQSGDQIPVQTIVNNTIQVQYVSATLHLAVTPQITADGSVILKVRVENKRPDFSRLVLGIPPIITQEAETVLLVKDGSTVVLGGIIRANEETTQARLPWIHRIPIIGWFFKNRNLTQENNELLIFLTPRIAKLS